MRLEKQVLINYRIERCNETIAEAKDAIKDDHPFNAENRIYYAMFYIVSALALKYNFSSGKHYQLLGWFNKNFIKTERIPKELGGIYTNAFEKRQKGDYDDLKTFTMAEVNDDFKDMIFFVEKLKKFINKD
jgi:uncharacterized protein (UPF0332 family)